MTAPTTRSIRAAYNPSVKVAYVNQGSGTTFTAIAAVTGKKISVLAMKLSFGGSGSSLSVRTNTDAIFDVLSTSTTFLALDPQPSVRDQVYIEHFCTDIGEALTMVTTAACKGTIEYVEVE